MEVFIVATYHPYYSTDASESAVCNRGKLGLGSFFVKPFKAQVS